MRFKKSKALFRLGLLLALLFVATILLINSLLKDPAVQRYLLREFSRAIGYESSTEKIELCLWGGIGIEVVRLRAVSKAYPERISASRARVIFDAGQLIKGRLVPSRIFLFQPVIQVDLDRRGQNPNGPGDSGPHETLLSQLRGFELVSMEHARIRFNGLPFLLEDLSFRASRKKHHPVTLEIRIRGRVSRNGDTASFACAGNVIQDADSHSNPNPMLQLTLKTGTVPLNWIPWPKTLLLKQGHAQGEFQVRGMLGGHMAVKGKIVAGDLSLFLVQSGRKKIFSFPRITADFRSSFSKSVFYLSSFHVKGPDLSLRGRARLNLKDRSDPHVFLELKSPFMPLDTAGKLTPFPLLPLWVESRLFPLLSKGEVQLAHLYLKGSLKRIEDLDRPENMGLLSLRVGWKDLELSGGDALPFQDLSGVLTIHKGRLRLSGLAGRFGKCRIKEASLDADELSARTPTYTASLDGTFDLQDLMRQREIPLIPPAVRQQLQRMEFASGKLESRLRLRYQAGWSEGRIVEGELRFSDCSIYQRQLLLPLNLDKARMRFDKPGHVRFNGTGLWGNTRFEATGSTKGSWHKARVHLLARADLNELMSRLHPGRGRPWNFREPVTCRISLSRSKDNWSCQGELDLSRMVLEAPLFTVNPPGTEDKATFHMDLYPGKRLELRNFVALFGNSLLKASGAYDLKSGDAISVRVSTPGIFLNDMGIRFKNLPMSAKGVILSDVQAKIPIRDPSRSLVTGTLEARHFSLSSTMIPSPITQCRLKVGLSGKEVRIERLNLRVGNSALRINGKLVGWEGLKGRLSVTADHLDLSDFLVQEPMNRSDPIGPGAKARQKPTDRASVFEARTVARESQPRSKGKQSPANSPSPEIPRGGEPSRFLMRSDIHMDIKGSKGLWRRLRYGPFEGELSLRSGNLHLGYARFRLPHGLVRVSGRAKSGNRFEPFFAALIKLKQQPVNDLLFSFGLKEGHIEGALTLKGAFYTRGKGRKGMISNLTGSTDILLEKGKIKESRVIFKILNFLSLQKIFSRKPPDLSKEGFYYERIMGHVKLNKGIMTTDDLIMKSPVFNAAAKGVVDLGKNRVDFDVGVQPLGTIDFILSKIPIFGYVITGKEKSILVYHFKMDGTLLEPDVRYVPMKNLGTSTIGFFKRLFFTPHRLFKNASRIVKDLSEQGAPFTEKELKEFMGNEF